MLYSRKRAGCELNGTGRWQHEGNERTHLDGSVVGSERCVETGEHALPRGGLLRERRRVREAQLPDVVELYADLGDEGDGVLARQPARDRVP